MHAHNTGYRRGKSIFPMKSQQAKLIGMKKLAESHALMTVHRYTTVKLALPVLTGMSMKGIGEPVPDIRPSIKLFILHPEYVH